MYLLLTFGSWEQGFFQSFSTLRRRQKQNQLLRFFYCRVKPPALLAILHFNVGSTLLLG